jgi:hypothetical protein
MRLCLCSRTCLLFPEPHHFQNHSLRLQDKIEEKKGKREEHGASSNKHTLCKSGCTTRVEAMPLQRAMPRAILRNETETV